MKLKNRIFGWMALAVFCMGSVLPTNAQEMETLSEKLMPEPIEDVFPRGNLSTLNCFTGDVYNQRLVSPTDDTPCQVSNVTFKAGSRTRWHVHTGTQILLCAAGRGWYQEKGQPAQALKAGDAVAIRPGVVHWHGAASDSEFSHLSVIPNPKQNKDTWLEEVSEEEYQSLKIK